MSTTKNKKIVENINNQLKGQEKKLDDNNYNESLLRALNYYNNIDDKVKKSWFIKYITPTDPKLAKDCVDLDEYHFRYIGIVTRLIDIGSKLRQAELQFFTERLELIKDIILQKKQSKTLKKEEKVVVKIAPVVAEKIDIKKYISDLDGAIDNYVTNNSKEFTAKGYIIQAAISTKEAKRVGEYYSVTARELQECLDGGCEQLTEGYSNFNRAELKKFLDFIKSIISACDQQEISAKVTRKRKPVPPARMTAKVKYMKEFIELNLKSINPASIIGTSEVWTYNTKERKISIYKTLDEKISVKGTTILGFDVKSSSQFKLRKPDEFFKDLVFGKRALNKIIKTLTTKPATPNGRINPDTIILGAF